MPTRNPYKNPLSQTDKHKSGAITNDSLPNKSPYNRHGAFDNTSRDHNTDIDTSRRNVIFDEEAGINANFAVNNKDSMATGVKFNQDLNISDHGNDNIYKESPRTDKNPNQSQQNLDSKENKNENHSPKYNDTLRNTSTGIDPLSKNTIQASENNLINFDTKFDESLTLGNQKGGDTIKSEPNNDVSVSNNNKNPND